MKKILIFIVVLISLSVFVSGVTNNITAFDDGSSDFNITANTTKYVTTLIGATISNVTLNITAYDNYFNDSFNRANSQTIGNGWVEEDYPSGGYTVQIYNGMAFFNTSGETTEIYMRKNISSYNQTVNLTGKINISVSGGFNAYRIFNLLNDTTPICGLYFTSGQEIFKYVAEGFIDTSYSFNDNSWYNVSIVYNYISKNCSFYLNQTYIGEGGFRTNSSLKTIEIGATFPVSGDFYVDDIIFEGTDTQDVKIKVNETIVYSNVGNLTGTHKIDLNKSVIQNYVTSNATIPITFSADVFGANFNIFDLFIKYNKTQSAKLTFVSPSEITKTSTGEDYTVEITMENTGDWNATNCLFQTVSSGTPNLNDDMTYSNFSILTTAQTTVNLTFSISESAEPDEKLQFYCKGTNDNQNVYSDFIDIDITYSVPDSGGGGGKPPKRCNWIIWKPRNKVWIGEGWYESIAKTNIVIWNNESQSITFNFLTKDLKDCTFEQNNMVVEGNSFGYNIVMCPFPVEKTIGKVIIEGGGCDSSINTSLEVSVKGLLLSLFFGKMGFYSLGLYLVIFMIIAMMVIK